MSQQQVEEKPIIIREASSLTAEMVAAVRAKYEDTPEAKALVTLSGTVLSNIFYVLAPKPVVNISPVRDITSNHLVETHLPQDGQERVFVDLACGYSSRGAVLARLRPDVQVYEIDLPNVITEKTKRYSRRGIAMPANHHMVQADMKTSSLSDLLDGNKADVVMARGLFIYFDLETIKQASRNIMNGLKPGGHLICDVAAGTEQAIGAFASVLNFMRKQTNSDASRGRVNSVEEGEALFVDAGYAVAKGYRFDDFEDILDLPHPYTNITLLVDAQTATEESVAKPSTKRKSTTKPTDTPKTTQKAKSASNTTGSTASPTNPTATDNVGTEPMKPDLKLEATQHEESAQKSTEDTSIEATQKEDTQNKSTSAANESA